MKKFILILGILLGLYGMTTAQTEEPEQKPFRITFSERARMTSVGEAATLDHNAPVTTFTRWRTYLGAYYNPSKHFEFRAELGNEARIYLTPRQLRRPSTRSSSINSMWIGKTSPTCRSTFAWDDSVSCLTKALSW